MSHLNSRSNSLKLGASAEGVRIGPPGKKGVASPTAPPTLFFAQRDHSSGCGPVPSTPLTQQEKFLERRSGSSEDNSKEPSPSPEGLSPRQLTGRQNERRQPFIIGVSGERQRCTPPGHARPSPPLSPPFPGGTASGKTTVCDYIMRSLPDQGVVMLSQDSFYKGLTPDQIANVNVSSGASARPPERWRWRTYATYQCRPTTLTTRTHSTRTRSSAASPICPRASPSRCQVGARATRLRAKLRCPHQQLACAVYDFSKHQRSPSESVHVRPSDVIIIEGILVLHMERIRSMLHMKIFVDTDDDVR